MFTDAWLRHGHFLLARGPTFLRALGTRFHPDIPSSLVTAFTASSVIRRARRDLFVRPRGDEEVYQWDLNYGAWFDRVVCRQLERMSVRPDQDAFLGFMSGALRSIQLMKSRGVPTILDQPGAGRIELEIVSLEMDRWPGWIDHMSNVPQTFWDVLSAEWQAADFVLVNSQWSRAALIQQGVPADRMIVVPCVYEPDFPPPPRREFRTSPFTVLFLGRVTLGKGIQYLIEAAKLLKDPSVRFIVVGPSVISEQAMGTAPPHVRFLGRVSREETSKFYRDADVFVFPTLCDGFGMTQLEAMAHGLPVIATPNCGDVVTHGEDGLIVPAADAQALAHAIASLADDRDRLEFMSAKAIVKSRQFTLARCADAVNEAVPPKLARA
jgi:glycosyltransferase involved in cell wall biosynthesis